MHRSHFLGSFHVGYLQTEWKIEIARQLEIIQVEGSNYPKIEEDLIRRRKDELRLDIYVDLFYSSLVI